MADTRLEHATPVAKPIPRFDCETYWAGAWLAAWQRCGNSVGADGDLIGFIYGEGADTDSVMTDCLQVLLNMTPSGSAMIARYIQRFGNGRVELYPFNPQSKVTQEAGQ